MSDELKPQSIGDDPEFRALLVTHRLVCRGEPLQAVICAIIAHIDVWGARLAGDAVERAARICEERGMHWQKEEGTYAAGKKAGAFDAAENIRMIAAAPTPKEDACGS